MTQTAPARIDAPKFHLRFERGYGLIRLGRPLRTGHGSIESLVMQLDVSGPLRLTGGAFRFRHHRSRLQEARFSLRTEALVQSARERGVAIRIDRSDSNVAVSMRDAVGTLAVEATVAVDGADILFFPRSLSFVSRGPVSPWSRLCAAARELGLVWSADIGAFRWSRPLRAALAEALLPHGWRVPEERGATLVFSKSGVTAQAGAAAVAPTSLCATGSELSASLERNHPWTDPLAYAEGGWGRLERALDDRDLATARAALNRACASAWLMAEATLAFVETFADSLEETDIGDRLLEALCRLPRDGATWTSWVEILATDGNAAALRLAHAAMTGPLPRARRATLAAIAVEGLLEHGEPHALAEHDALSQELVAEAERLAPELPWVIAARAALAHRAGDREAAARGWQRAADGSDTPRRAARWRRRAAELLLGLHGPAAAEPLLRQALLDLERAGSDEPTLVAQLASVVAERGERRESSELFARLLRDVDPNDDAWRAAVLAAARFHVEAGDHDRARPFLAALGDDEEAANDVEQSDESSVSMVESIIEVVSDSLDSAERDLDDVFDADPFDTTDPRLEPPVSVVEFGNAPPPVTLVSVADEDVRALLKEARTMDDPTGLLEGALERALEDADPDGVRRVLRVLDRLAGFAGESKLRERALRLIRRLGEEP